MRRFTGPARALLVLLAVVAALFVFVFPTSAYISQRNEINDVRSRVDTMDEQNERLAREAARLRDPDQIEELARERYHLVRPGEKSFAVIPLPDTVTTTPATSAPAAPTTTAVPIMD